MSQHTSFPLCALHYFRWHSVKVGTWTSKMNTAMHTRLLLSGLGEGGVCSVAQCLECRTRDPAVVGLIPTTAIIVLEKQISYISLSLFLGIFFINIYIWFVQIISLYIPSLQFCFWLFQPFSSVGKFPLSTSGVYFFRVPSRFSFGSFAFCRRHFLLWGHVQNNSRRLLSVSLLYKILILSALQRLYSSRCWIG